VSVTHHSPDINKLACCIITQIMISQVLVGFRLFKT
jgi:hypothetical protein